MLINGNAKGIPASSNRGWIRASHVGANGLSIPENGARFCAKETENSRPTASVEISVRTKEQARGQISAFAGEPPRNEGRTESRSGRRAVPLALDPHRAHCHVR